MEIIIKLYVEDISKAIDYYIEELKVFDLITSTSNSATLSYSQNDKIIFHLNKANEETESINISLQVPNAEKLYNYIDNKRLGGRGIIKSAYKFEDQEITFLTAPPGDYFYTSDQFGNTIQFFDKYEERVN